MKAYEFWWSPEGRKVATITALSRTAAKSEFKRLYRGSYARYMGEVYIVEL